MTVVGTPGMALMMGVLIAVIAGLVVLPAIRVARWLYRRNVSVPFKEWIAATFAFHLRPVHEEIAGVRNDLVAHMAEEAIRLDKIDSIADSVTELVIESRTPSSEREAGPTKP